MGSFNLNMEKLSPMITNNWYKTFYQTIETHATLQIYFTAKAPTSTLRFVVNDRTTDEHKLIIYFAFTYVYNYL